MTNLILIVALPLLMAVLGFSAHKLPFFKQLIAFCAWYQIGIELFLFRALFTGKDSVHFVDGLVADRTGALFALLACFVVASALCHACVFFKNEGVDRHKSSRRNVGIFFGSSGLFLLAMTLLCICNNLGYLWICIEATTLVSAPLVFYSRDKHALEATWKYLIICSVGIAFALLGTIMIFASSQQQTEDGTLHLTELMARAGTLDYPLLRMGFILCFLGYGTKAGVFPIHSWLPDAHSEAPAPASAMLSGALLNCALLAIWRISQVVVAAGHPELALKLPLVFGTVTVAAASLFLVKQSGIKRLWAYSSIENVGLMLTAIGLGAAPLFFLQALNHSLAKVAAFLLAGNFVQACGSKKLSELKGLLILSPSWAILLALAAIAVTGAPPFGAFISELYMLTKSNEMDLCFVFVTLVVSLTIGFIAVCYHVSGCLWGKPAIASINANTSWLSILIPATLIFLALLLGVTPISKYIIEVF
ncbi:MAG: hypothetical protein K2X77_20725 [Candidatus Obscuribacterales bacterium]|jgi:hydrogenase-4 component F|nr:hypothetical protein [Candidatus Obscuribacterales bacterium]